MTYAQLADDILVTMGYIHDDALRHRESVLYNVLLVVNKLKDQQLTKQLDKGDHKAASSMTSTYIVPVTHRDAGDSSVTEWDACYFDLPTSVYSLPNDRGVVFVRYLRNEIEHGCPPAVTRTPFTAATLASMNAIQSAKYQAPSPARPYYARGRESNGTVIKDRVYVFGVKKAITHLLVGLFAAPDFTTVDPNENIDLPDELLLSAKKMLIDLESWALQVPQERLRNDGREFEPGQIVRTRPLMSVNDPNQIDP